MRRDVERQRDFAEAFLPEEVGRDEVLERVDALVDWSAPEAVCGDIYAAPVGRSSYPVRVLIKAMLVQAWRNLSDPKAEQLLRNDLRFRRFLGVGLVGKTPDEKPCGGSLTSWRTEGGRDAAGRGATWKLADGLLPEDAGDPALERLDALLDRRVFAAVCNDIYVAPVERRGGPRVVLLPGSADSGQTETLAPKPKHMPRKKLRFGRVLSVGFTARTPDQDT